MKKEEIHMEFDRDLLSIQEVRCLVRKAKAAQEQCAAYTQEQVDAICAAMADAGARNAQRLAQMAAEETGFGIPQDKVLKNLLGSAMTWDAVKDMKTVGVIREDAEKGILEVAVPMGVVAALIPSTNPTSTVLYKSIISVKAGNAIVISPHPGAKNCILEAWKVVSEAAKKAGAPDGLIQCVTTPSAEGTSALLKHRDVGIILATGGEAMVRAAYSSGNPALGVGPGNGPAFIEKSADIPTAVRRILESKTFDNGTICASEQSIVTERCIQDKVVEEVKRQGGYFLSPEESEKVSKFIMRANGTMNPKIVGKTAQVIASVAQPLISAASGAATVPEASGQPLSLHSMVTNCSRVMGETASSPSLMPCATAHSMAEEYQLSPSEVSAPDMRASIVQTMARVSAASGAKVPSATPSMSPAAQTYSTAS